MAIPQGTGFINLNRILQANQNNRLGQQIGSGLSNDKSQIDQQREQQQQQFNSDITKEQQDRSTAQGQQGQILNNLDTNPSNITDQDANKYASFRNYSYTGPQGLSNQDALNNGTQNYQQTVDLGRSRGGRQQLISQYAAPRTGYNNPSYNNLDELYLGNKDFQVLKNARTGANQLAQQNNQAIQGAQGQVQQEQIAANQFKQQANNAVNTRNQQLMDLLNQRATTDTANDTTAYQNLINGGAFQQIQPNLSKDNAGNLGLSNPLNTYNFGVTPDTFINKGTTATASSVADTTERARSAALAKLAGITDAVDVNAPNYQGTSLNSDAYTKAINDALSNYKSDLSNNTLASTGFAYPVATAIGPNNPDPNQSLAQNFQTLNNVKQQFTDRLNDLQNSPQRYNYIDGQKVDMYQRELDNYNQWLNNTYNPILQSNLVKKIQGKYNLS